jgi:hypothetical protein
MLLMILTIFRIREMLQGYDGYTFWFVKQYFDNKCPLDELNNILQIIKNEKANYI